MLAPSVEPRSARGCGEESSHFQVAFGRLLPCLGDQSEVWAVAHRFCRVVCKILLEGVTMYRAVRARALRKLGYEVTITPINQLAVRVAVHV
jgi:hypothetical protein